MPLEGSRWAAPAGRSLSTATHRPNPLIGLSLPSKGREQFKAPPLADGQSSISKRCGKLHLAGRVLRRLRWKGDYLVLSHSRALHEEAGAALMFKLDFFEYHQLLERCIVCLLSALGIEVSSSLSFSSTDEPLVFASATKSESFATQNIIGTRAYVSNESRHRFHANVLLALEDNKSPLHAALGQGDAFRFLTIAKDFRNRWKDADTKQESNDTILQEMNIENFCRTLIVALEMANEITTTYVSDADSEELRSRDESNDDKNDYIDEDIPFEAVEEPMDWES